MPEFRSTYKYAKTSARKVRLVIDQIRGRSLSQAEAILRFSDKRAAVMIQKTLKSAVANAQNAVDRRDLVVTKCWVDEGPTRRTWLPRSRGMATPLLHRSSHITVCVGEKDGTLRQAQGEKKESKKENKK